MKDVSRTYLRLIVRYSKHIHRSVESFSRNLIHKNCSETSVTRITALFLLFRFDYFQKSTTEAITQAEWRGALRLMLCTIRPGDVLASAPILSEKRANDDKNLEDWSLLIDILRTRRKGFFVTSSSKSILSLVCYFYIPSKVQSLFRTKENPSRSPLVQSFLSLKTWKFYFKNNPQRVQSLLEDYLSFSIQEPPWC